jgi:hypothetical protein
MRDDVAVRRVVAKVAHEIPERLPLQLRRALSGVKRPISDENRILRTGTPIR